MGDDTRLSGMLDAYDNYRYGLLELFRTLDIADVWAGDPRLLFASLIVAETVGGIALPPPEDHELQRFGTVFGPLGENVRVLCVSDRDAIWNGWIVNSEREEFDTLALVAFVHASPVAVHLIPANRIAGLSRALGGTRVPNGRIALTMLMHTDLMLESTIAAVNGVITIDLLSVST